MADLSELAAALVKAQAEFPSINKSETNPFFKSKYADLATVVKTAAPILAKHGLAVSQFVDNIDGASALTTLLIHESGQHLMFTAPLMLPKDDPQGQGSAITYARRYGYMSALGLVADVDDDGNKATTTYKKPEPKAEHITADQVAKLLSLAKLKGYTDKADAVQFLNARTGLEDFTKLEPWAFEATKAIVSSLPGRYEVPE